MMAKRPALIISCLIVAALAILVYALCISAVWLGDDTFFSFNLASDNWLQRINSLGDIVESQTYYYMTSLGRFVTHCIVQFFCGIAGQTAFAVCNALVWIAFVIMLTRSAGYRFKERPMVVFTMAALAFICLRTQFTPPCQVNYIWALTATLVVVEFYRRPEAMSIWATVLLVPFCFLAGWGQESVSSGIAAAMWIYALLNFRSMTLRHWLMLVAYTAGMLFLCLAPGNFTRVGKMSSLRATPYATAYFLRATYLFILLVIVLLAARKTSLVKIYKENAFWINAMFFMGVFNLIAKVYCNRQLFGIEVMSIILIVKLLSQYPLGKPSLKTLGAGVLGVLVVLVAVEDFNTIAKRTAVVDKLAELYQASPDGVVYCDISDEDYFYADEDAMNSINSWSLFELKRVWETQGNEDRPLEWRPLAMKDLLGKQLESQVIKLGEKQNLYLLIWEKQDTTSAFELTEDWYYGPVKAVHNVMKYSVKNIEHERVGTNIIRDTYFNAVVWRQTGVIINCTDVKLVKSN